MTIMSPAWGEATCSVKYMHERFHPGPEPCQRGQHTHFLFSPQVICQVFIRVPSVPCERMHMMTITLFKFNYLLTEIITHKHTKNCFLSLMYSGLTPN